MPTYEERSVPIAGTKPCFIKDHCKQWMYVIRKQGEFVVETNQPSSYNNRFRWTMKCSVCGYEESYMDFEEGKNPKG